MVSQPDRGRCLGVHGDEGHVTAHLHGLTGLIDLVGCRVLPEQEPQVAILRSQDRGVAAALIGVVVLRALLVAFYVGNLEGFQRSGEVGHQNHRGIELGIRVEQRLCAVAVHGEPGAGLLPVIAGSDLFHQFRVAGSILQGRAIGNAQRFSHTVDVDCQINGCVDLGGRPLGIEGDVLGGHGLAVEYESSAFTGLVIIPTSKLVTRRHTVRPGGFIAYIAQGLLILQRQRPFRGAIVDEDNVVTVADVVEFGVVIIAAKAGSFLIGKTGDRISIFLCDNISPARRGIAMVQLVGNSALVDRTSLSRENLYIVVCRFASAVLIRPIVAAATYGHNIDVTLICSTVPSSTPRTAAINRRPLVRDVCTVLCGNGYLADISAGTAVCMLFLRTAKPFAPFAMRMLLLPAGVIRIIQIERNGIHIALVVHIHNGAAVTGDGLLLNGLSLEALIALGRSFRFLAGGAGLGFGLLKGIILIIGIFLPVDHGVLGVRRCGPVGLQVRRCVDLGHRLSVLIPAVEGIARPGRSRQRHGLALLSKDGGHIVAALGIEDDPVAGLDHRINLDGTGGEGNRTGLTALGAAPAHNGFRGAQRQVHHLGSGIQVGIGNGIAAAALGGMYNGAAVLAHEQDIAEFREHCIDPNGFAGNTADRAGHHRDLILAVEPVPALEHGPVLAGVAGHIQGLAFLKALCPGILPDTFHIELIGIDQGLIVFHNAALGRIGLAGLATIVDMAIRALGGAGGANQLFLSCSGLRVNRVHLCHAALAAGAHIIAVCTDLAVGIGMLHIAEVLAAAGLGLRFRLLVGCAGCVFLVLRIPGAIVRGCIAIFGIACFRIFLGCAGCVFLVFRIPGAIVRGCIAIFGIVCFRIFLGCVLRRCSRSLGCAGCVCGVLLCLHRLGGFCAAGGRLCKGTHRAQAEQHANRQQHCDPSFHVLLPLV